MKKIFLFSFFLITASLTNAQELAVVEKRAPQTVPFAQPFAVQFLLSHTPGQEVILNEESLSKDFEVTQRSTIPNSPGTLTYDLTVIPFTLGKSTFTAVFELKEEDKTTATAEEEIYIEISPADTFFDKNLREIRPPHIPAGWLAWLLAALLLAATVYVWRWWYKRLHAEKPLSVLDVQDNRPSDVIALSKIDALLDSGLWENGQYKMFYITLSDILREYLLRQFQVDVSADTSAELLRRVKNMPQMGPLMSNLREFLSSGDLVKFAKAVPSTTVRDKDVQLLREIITETMPKPTPNATLEEAL